jgi:hypothetical protein
MTEEANDTWYKWRTPITNRQSVTWHFEMAYRAFEAFSISFGEDAAQTAFAAVMTAGRLDLKAGDSKPLPCDPERESILHVLKGRLDIMTPPNGKPGVIAHDLVAGDHYLISKSARSGLIVRCQEDAFAAVMSKAWFDRLVLSSSYIAHAAAEGLLLGQHDSVSRRVNAATLKPWERVYWSLVGHGRRVNGGKDVAVTASAERIAEETAIDVAEVRRATRLMAARGLIRKKGKDAYLVPDPDRCLQP